MWVAGSPWPLAAQKKKEKGQKKIKFEVRLPKPIQAPHG